MPDEADKDSKTEDPTAKKISDALEKGNVPFSREITNSVSLLAILISGYFYLPGMVIELGWVLKGVFANLSSWPMDTPENFASLHSLLGKQVLLIVTPVIIPLIVFGLAASLSQNMPSLVLNRIAPKASKLSILKGLKRLFGKQGFREFGKALFKFSAAGIIATTIAVTQIDFVITRVLAETSTIPVSIFSLFIKVLIGLTLTAFILGVVDLIWVRKDWRDDLKMTLQEVKDENKQSEGDPMVKMKYRSIAQDRTRRNMISNVEGATLVITNPTHYAIAMRYDPIIDKVPVVLAKGKDLIALKIREVANENDIPITEDPPLARALYSVVQVDSEIPLEFYVPLAAIIRSLNQSKPQVSR